METQLEIGERIKQLRKHLKLTQTAFGQLIGITDSATISKYEKGLMPLAKKAELELFSSLKVRKEWLYEGKGEMFEQTEGKPRPTGNDIRAQKAFGETDDKGLIFVPIRAQAGYTRNFTDPVFIDQLERIYIPDSPYRGDEFRYFEVEGDSMEPTFQDGMWVIGQYVAPEHWNSIKNYHVHVIVTDEHVYIKRLYKLNPETLVMISDNEALYPQEKLSVADIKELWMAKRKLDWNMVPPKNFDIKFKE